MNEIVFPAAVLHPPFFDVNADDAVNYRGIGAVIGHEISHGFDDEGSQYDGDGKLLDPQVGSPRKTTSGLLPGQRRWWPNMMHMSQYRGITSTAN